MQNIYTFIFLIFLTTQMYSQSKKIIYVDENFKKIDFLKFNKKLDSKLFSIAKVKTDTALFKKLRFKEYFGELNKQKKSQINKLFEHRFRIDSTKAWIIHYFDILPNINQVYLNRNYFKDSLALDYEKIFSGGLIEFNKKGKRIKTNAIRHLNNSDHLKKVVAFERKKFKKYKNVRLLHFYNKNLGFPLNNLKDELFKDSNSILKNIFNDGMSMYRTIILHPNGSFYASSCGNKCDFYNEKKLMKLKTFKKLQNQFQRKYQRLN